MRAFPPILIAVLFLSVSALGCQDDAPDGGSGNGDNNAPNNDSNNTPNNDPNNDPMGPVCGNDLCEEGEQATCPEDCEPDPEPDPQPVPEPEPQTECGNGECEEGEDRVSCPDDCDVDDRPVICEPGETRCRNNNTLETCNEAGTEWTIGPCPVGQICEAEQGICVPVMCRPGEVISCASQTTIFVCNETGTGQIEEVCEEGFFCDFLNGAFTCTNQVCNPGDTRCAGNEGTETCNDEGTAWLPATECEEGTQCDSGECKSLCEINSKVSSFLGCEYWSADLDNIEGGTAAPHAVIISNPNDIAAVITVYDAHGEEVLVEQWPSEVPPGTLETWVFDPAFLNTNTNAPVVDTGRIDGTIIVDQTYQFISSVPVTAHQFNPLVDRNVFTNDASLLLPTNALGQEYLVMSWKHRPSPVIRGFVSVLAVGEEPTTVTVTPRAAVVAGTNSLDNTPIERIPTGEAREFVLMPGQLLNLETEGPAEADLTGTEIITDQPVIVFGGHECANVPLGFNFCDHIEQQMFPVPSWGSQYIGTHFVDRDPNTPQNEVWRILAGEDQVVVTTVPPIENVDGITLNRGDFIEFETNTNFELSATGPILVGQYMTGSAYTGGASIGDPAFTLASPIEQWRRDYIVLTPPAYERGDFLNIIAPTGSTIFLDDVPVDLGEFEVLGNGTFSSARIPVEDGPHILTSEAQFTVIPYGYDSAVSYAYPGGLNLEDLNR